MKNVIISERLEQDSQLAEFAKRGTDILEDVLGPSAQFVNAQWDRMEDEKGRTFVTLQISDWTGKAAARFVPWETEQSIRPRLYHLWGDLLAQR